MPVVETETTQPLFPQAGHLKDVTFVLDLMTSSFSHPRCQPRRNLDEKQFLFLVTVLARNRKEPAG